MSSKEDATIRQINMMLREIEVIEIRCTDGKSAKKAAKQDPFSAARRDLHELLTTVKADIKTQKNLQERKGAGPDVISLRSKNEKALGVCHDHVRKMEEALLKDRDKAAKGKSGALPEDELDKRGEVLDLMKQDLAYAEWEFKPDNQQQSKGASREWRLARDTKEKNAKRRQEMGANAPEPIPLTEKQQAFIQETVERNEVIDQKLDQILQGVRILNQIADDVGVELDAQDKMLDELETKMDNANEKIQNNNERLKKILDDTGGATRWCPLMIACIILVALVGYIWSLISKGKVI